MAMDIMIDNVFFFARHFDYMIFRLCGVDFESTSRRTLREILRGTLRGILRGILLVLHIVELNREQVYQFSAPFLSRNRIDAMTLQFVSKGELHVAHSTFLVAATEWWRT